MADALVGAARAGPEDRPAPAALHRSREARVHPDRQPLSDALLDDYLAAIDRFESVLRACPDDRLTTPCWRVRRTDAWMPQDCEEDDLQVFSAFWMTAAHALYFLDFYLNDADAPFAPAFPHFDTGFDDDWKVLFPTRVLERDELLAALAHGREKATRVIPTLTDEQLAGRMPDWHPHAGTTFADLLRGNLDHLAEHTAHLEAVVSA